MKILKTPEEVYDGLMLRDNLGQPNRALCITAIRTFHAQYEGECEWRILRGTDWLFPNCYTGEPYYIQTDKYKYCPFCGRKIKRV